MLTGTLLRLGDDAMIVVTGLRNPCGQIEDFQAGLLSEVALPRPDGSVVRKTGVMGIVVLGGVVRPGDPIALAMPPGRPQPLSPV